MPTTSAHLRIQLCELGAGLKAEKLQSAAVGTHRPERRVPSSEQ
jgi:hypothetical protein